MVRETWELMGWAWEFSHKLFNDKVKRKLRETTSMSATFSTELCWKIAASTSMPWAVCLSGQNVWNEVLRKGLRGETAKALHDRMSKTLFSYRERSTKIVPVFRDVPQSEYLSKATTNKRKLLWFSYRHFSCAQQSVWMHYFPSLFPSGFFMRIWHLSRKPENSPGYTALKNPLSRPNRAKLHCYFRCQHGHSSWRSEATVHLVQLSLDFLRKTTSLITSISDEKLMLARLFSYMRGRI